MKVDDATRRRLATGWDPRVCTAREYARSVGTSERALRLWRARLAPDHANAVPVRHGSMPPAATVHVLLARLADADAALDAARAAVAACRGALGAAAASAASADVEELGANEAPSPVAVRPDQAPVTPETQEPPARSESDAVVQKPAARGTFYWG